MFIQTETTPNPDVLKFLPGRDVLRGGGREFRRQDDAVPSDLAKALLDIVGVESVYFGDDFITVSRDRAQSLIWAQLKAPILAAIMDHYLSGDLLIDEGATFADETVYSGETAQIVAEIKELLETKVRPNVAQDGGDIVFEHFDDQTGVLYVRMKGACAGCPSSTATLRHGVEQLMKHYVPEVKAIEPVQ